MGGEVDEGIVAARADGMGIDVLLLNMHIDNAWSNIRSTRHVDTGEVGGVGGWCGGSLVGWEDG